MEYVDVAAVAYVRAACLAVSATNLVTFWVDLCGCKTLVKIIPKTLFPLLKP